nr:MAG TPA_asm: hypothetical protein [Caudoviricetes sp.]
MEGGKITQDAPANLAGAFFAWFGKLRSTHDGRGMVG